MKVTEDIRYVGVNDHNLDMFESMYKVPKGMAYNSYVIIDEKIAVMDSVEEDFGNEWLENLRRELKGRTPDYLVVQHMEPDHSANIVNFLEAFPNATVVSNSKAFAMLNNYFGCLCFNRQEVKDNEVLCLGKHNLQFLFAPMVHWPEVMVTYDSTDKVLFSADAFGKFGALDCNESWDDEARRYYIGIVGKYGVQVQALLKKISQLPVEAICPLHGPVLTDNIAHCLKMYDVWSGYGVESDGVLIAYTSVYGHTAKAALFAKELLEKCGQKVVVHDLARCDLSQAVADAFRYGKILLATTTYNMQVFPPMRNFVLSLTDRNFQNRTLAIIENGSWAPMAAKVLETMFANSKNVNTVGTVTIRSSMTEENKQQIEQLVEKLCR